MRALFLSILFFCCLPQINFAQDKHIGEKINLERSIKKFSRKHFSVQIKPKKKIIVAALDLSMGFLGVHRLYLGTSTKVPVVYAITLGGGGFLILSDLIITIATKDIEKYSNNEHILLWNTED